MSKPKQTDQPRESAGGPLRRLLETTPGLRIASGTGTKPETILRNSIVDTLGNGHGVRLIVNAIDNRGAMKRGLGEGSPDIVGWLIGSGRTFCLEVKVPGKRATKEQLQWHAAARSQGVFVAVVHSIEESKAAIQRAKEGLSE